MINKVYIKTHGCHMNVYDSNSMAQLLEQNFGATVTDDEQEADLLLLNTCSIREKAQEKVFSQLGRWKKLKQQDSRIMIGVVGCVASQEGEKITKRSPFVDFVLGPQILHKLPNLIKDKITHKRKKAAVNLSFDPIAKFDALPNPKVSGPEALVTVMEGCSKYCTFCVVPYTRGAEVSRSFHSILEEINFLASKGVKEVTLLGQNVNGYLTNYSDAEGKQLEIDFSLLLQAIAKIPSIKRIRFSTSHPIEFSDNLIETYKHEPKLVSHVHLPVQSGSDRILTLMKRQHTIADYKHIIKNLKQARPNISISSDFIVGFPGETDEDFADTMQLIEDINFDTSFSFIYSPRPNTPAGDNMQDTLPLVAKKERLQILQDQIKKQANVISNSMLNSTQDILVNSYSKKNIGNMQGRSANNRVVHFNSIDPKLIGKIVPVTINTVMPNSMFGTLLAN